MEWKYTRHQVARGTRADEETYDRVLLIKRVSELRATYQIRLLTYMAFQKGKKLVIEVPIGCRIHRTLRHLMKEYSATIKIVST